MKISSLVQREGDYYCIRLRCSSNSFTLGERGDIERYFSYLEKEMRKIDKTTRSDIVYCILETIENAMRYGKKDGLVEIRYQLSDKEFKMIIKDEGNGFDVAHWKAWHEERKAKSEEVTVKYREAKAKTEDAKKILDATYKKLCDKIGGADESGAEIAAMRNPEYRQANDAYYKAQATQAEAERIGTEIVRAYLHYSKRTGRLGGIGLLTVHGIMDRVEFNEKGNEITIYKNLDKIESVKK
jgi:anti-sigma regulatory factor (Ser/Thr protein kinase)